MNTTRLHPPLRTLISRVLFAGFALITPLLYAQTFAGRAFLTESPVSLRAIVNPDAYRTAIKVRLENFSNDAVRIRITNEKRETVYDNVVLKPRYIGWFDLSALPHGSYTMELSTRYARHTQQFRIKPQTDDRVVMVADPIKGDSLLAKQ